jgi:hypothetical protein
MCASCLPRNQSKPEPLPEPVAKPSQHEQEPRQTGQCKNSAVRDYDDAPDSGDREDGTSSRQIAMRLVGQRQDKRLLGAGLVIDAVGKHHASIVDVRRRGQRDLLGHARADFQVQIGGREMLMGPEHRMPGTPGRLRLACDVAFGLIAFAELCLPPFGPISNTPGSVSKMTPTSSTCRWEKSGLIRPP